MLLCIEFVDWVQLQHHCLDTDDHGGANGCCVVCMIHEFIKVIVLEETKKVIVRCNL